MLQPLPYRFSTGFRVSGCRHARRLCLQHMFFSVTFNRVCDCLLHRGDGHERIDVRNPIRIVASLESTMLYRARHNPPARIAGQ
ncbi:hypothetical protein [Ralstonia solanacearum]|uniref:Uncharacterized protein n=1 Tax=Ralstonia solanacearum TaxID=305 RepID=A0AAE3NH33_RALSL|nr:hypothetical protein [Ralstonia solanacearum]MBB6584770.1 hypothetical protein [Ralstonia solanacearum]MDB0520879.1 hypothetical protein [Ralstonia solanacearum]